MDIRSTVRRATAAAAIVCLTLVATACDGDGSAAADVTFSSGVECTSSYDENRSPGTATYTVRNDTSSLANFELVRLGVSYEAATVRLWENPYESDEGAGFMETVGDRIQLAPGETGEVIGELTPGTYTMLCIVLNDPEDQDMIGFIPAGGIAVEE
jgi:hypothetical protein